MLDEYPRMLFRPAKGEGEMLWGERVDNLTVYSFQEESSAIKEKWIRDPSQACALSAKMKKHSILFAWFVSHWQFWVTTIIAIIVAVISIK